MIIYMRIFLRSFFLFVATSAAALFLGTASPVFAAGCIFASAGDSDFNTAANWSCGHVPTGADNINVPVSTTTNMSANVTTSGGLTVEGTLNAVSFTMAAGSMTVPLGGVATSTSGTYSIAGGAVANTGTIGTGTGNCLFTGTVQNDGTIDIGSGVVTSSGAFTNAGTITGGSGILAVGLSWVNTAGTFNAQSGTVRVYNGGNPGITITLPGHLYNNVQILNAEADTVSLTTSSTVLGTLEVGGIATLTANTSTINVLGVTTIGSGTVVTSTTGGFSFSSAVSSTGSFGTVSGNTSFASTFQNNGTFDISSGTATTTGTLTNAAGGTIRGQTGTLSLVGSFTNSGTFTAGSGTVRVAGTAAQTIGGAIYNNFGSIKTAETATMAASSTVLGTLDASGSGGTLSASSNAFTVVGVATILSGATVTSTSGTLTFGAAVTSTGSLGSTSGNMAFASTVQNNGTLDIGSGTATSTGAFTNAAGATLRGQTGTLSTLAAFTNAGTFTAGTGTFRVAGTAAQNVTGSTFYNFTSIKASGTATIVTSAATVGGALTTSGGGTLSSAALALTVTGASTIGASTVVTSTSGALTFTGAVTSTGTIGSGTGVQMFSSTYQNNGTWAHGSGAVTSTGTMTDAAGATINCGSGEWDVMASWTEAGTFNRQTCKVRFVGTAAQTIPAVTFYNVSFRNAIGSSLSGTTYVSTTMDLISGASLAIGGYTLVVPNTITNNGTITISNTGSFIHAAASNAFTDSAGSAVTSYTQGGSVYVTIEDPSRNLLSGAADTLIVAVRGDTTSGGDTEYMTLTETGANTGIFRNTTGATLSGTSPTGGNGILEGIVSGTLTGTYTDAYDSADVLAATKAFTITSVAGSTGGGGSAGGGGSTGLAAPTPTVQSLTTTNGVTSTSNINNSNGNVTQNLQNLTTIGVSTNSLVKLADDGNANTQEDTAVYFVAADGRRHAFPNSRVYFTWFTNFNNVQIITSAKMASIPLGSNVTYKPGVKLVKFPSLAKVYAVSRGGELHWVKTEALAVSLYGAAWNTMVDDINDAFFTNYFYGSDINVSTDYVPASQTAAATSISWNFGL